MEEEHKDLVNQDCNESFVSSENYQEHEQRTCEQDVVRVIMSEYLCLTAHLEAGRAGRRNVLDGMFDFEDLAESHAAAPGLSVSGRGIR